jgi:hypothetical protein
MLRWIWIFEYCYCLTGVKIVKYPLAAGYLPLTDLKMEDLTDEGLRLTVV